MAKVPDYRWPFPTMVDACRQSLTIAVRTRESWRSLWRPVMIADDRPEPLTIAADDPWGPDDTRTYTRSLCIVLPPIRDVTQNSRHDYSINLSPCSNRKHDPSPDHNSNPKRKYSQILLTLGQYYYSRKNNNYYYRLHHRDWL